jgi:hypothetical protein
MIEIFTKTEFEDVLDAMEKDVVPLGLLNFEYCYLILVTKKAAINRSKVLFFIIVSLN